MIDKTCSIRPREEDIGIIHASGGVLYKIEVGRMYLVSATFLNDEQLPHGVAHVITKVEEPRESDGYQLVQLVRPSIGGHTLEPSWIAGNSIASIERC